MAIKLIVPQFDWSLVSIAILSSGFVLSACNSENGKERQEVTVASDMQELREQAGLHPPDKRPALVEKGDGGLRGANDPKLRDKVGLTPVRAKDQPKSPEGMREQVDLHPDRDTPPKNEAEMRERMGLHPERVEEK